MNDRCRCNWEMPGTCPGPAYCPMCQDDEDDIGDRDEPHADADMDEEEGS